MCCFFFFNDTATTEIYTLSLHDALPISPFISYASRRSFRISEIGRLRAYVCSSPPSMPRSRPVNTISTARSEEHTSELQSPCNLVCRLLLEKKQRSQHYAAVDRTYEPIA